MKTVKLTAVLDYYDGIQIFAAGDAIGGHYIATAIDTVGDFDRYLVVGVRPERLREFEAGQLDLRTLLLEAPGGEWYTTIADGTIDDPLTLAPQAGPLAATDYLPEPGFLLEMEAPVGEADLRQALASGQVANLTGKLEWADRRSGSWGLLTDAGVKSGQAVAGGAALDGLQIGKPYRFHCALITELDPLWRERQALYLVEIENA